LAAMSLKLNLPGSDDTDTGRNGGVTRRRRGRGTREGDT
jgi:hypothetical protein